MNLRQLIFALWALIFPTVVFVSCSDNDDPAPDVPKEITNGSYVLNSGTYSMNNTTLTYYDFATKKTSNNVYEAVNGKKLGDTGQDIINYGSKIYMTVYMSGVIIVTDKQGNSIASIQEMNGQQPHQPRYLTAYDGKIYVSYFDGYIARIDTTTLKVEKKIKVGDNPEQLKVANGKLYVANSGGMNYPTYSNTVSVVDVNTFTLTKNIEVEVNPQFMETDEQGDVYVISTGNYPKPDDPKSTDVFSTLQRIDSKTDQVTKVGNASRIASDGEKLYLIYSQYYFPDMKYSVYDAINEKIITDNFITDGTQLKSPSFIKVDVYSGNVYMGDSPSYTSNGDIYVFSPEGKQLSKFDSGGLNPAGICFINK